MMSRDEPCASTALEAVTLADARRARWSGPGPQTPRSGAGHGLHRASSPFSRAPQERLPGRLDREVVHDATDVLDVLGDLYCARTHLFAVDRPGEVHGPAIRLDPDAGQRGNLLGGELGLDLRGDRQVVDVFAGCLAGRRRAGRQHDHHERDEGECCREVPHSPILLGSCRVQPTTLNLRLSTEGAIRVPLTAGGTNRGEEGGNAEALPLDRVVDERRASIGWSNSTW